MGLLGERQCIPSRRRPKTRTMLIAAQAGAEGAFQNKDPFAACAPFVEHAAGIDLKPIGFEFGKGLGHAGRPELR